VRQAEVRLHFTKGSAPVRFAEVVSFGRARSRCAVLDEAPWEAMVASPTQEGANMLVLSRQRDETIMIGDDIEVTVVDIRGDKVRLGINDPKEISVHRKEVYEAIRRENKAAAEVKPEDLSGIGKIVPKKDAHSQAPAKDEKK
jgi:carbon storage regulator